MSTEYDGDVLHARLLSLRDEAYRQFHCRLIPDVDPARVIGVRTPQLRAQARELERTGEAEAFLRQLPHQSYEENNLHGILISRIRSFDVCLTAVDEFLPHVDNWATCDMLSPSALARQPQQLLEAVDRWLHSGEPYTVRFGIGRLMTHFLDEQFSPAYPEMVAAVQSDKYYVNMMRAWYFATALAKQYEAVLPYFAEQRLDSWTHNKAIQKAVESFRVAPEHKQALRALRRTAGRAKAQPTNNQEETTC